MGAINYKTSDYITIGYNLNYVDYKDEFYSDYISDYYDQVQYRLNQEDFKIFNVTIEPGYYEGFSIDIKLDYLYFDDYIEKQEAQKEVTQIKNFLLECINDFECTSVYPGWCTGYADYKKALKDLDDAIWEMRDAVKNTLTYKQYKAG
jgi:hypothetical protein